MQTFTAEASEAIRTAIRETGGAEVFFVGRRGPDAVVAEVQVVARGHLTAVPAVLAAAHTGEVVIHNHPSGVLRPSEADLDIAARASERGVGFLIVNNAATEAYVVVEPFQPRERKVVAPDEVAAMLGPDGRPTFQIQFYAVNKAGDYGCAGLFPTKYAASDEASGARLLDGAYLYQPR